MKDFGANFAPTSGPQRFTAPNRCPHGRHVGG